MDNLLIRPPFIIKAESAKPSVSIGATNTHLHKESGWLDCLEKL